MKMKQIAVAVAVATMSACGGEDNVNLAPGQIGVFLNGEVDRPHFGEQQDYNLAIYSTNVQGNPTGTPVCVRRVTDGFVVRMVAKDDSVLIVRVSHAPCDVTQPIDNTVSVGFDMVESYVHIKDINDYTVDINRDTTKKAVDVRAMVVAGVTLVDAVEFNK